MVITVYEPYMIVTTGYEVSKETKIRNRNNLVPHLTQGTTRESIWTLHDVIYLLIEP